MRYGVEEGYVYVAPCKVPVSHPPVRTIGGDEVSWATHRACQIPSVASHAVRERMLFGLASCQQHHADPSLTAAAPSKTTVSSPGWVALTIDGIRVGHHPVLALVIDKAGRKRILGLAEAATESCTMVKSLLIDWVERGLAIPNGTWP